jgi:hypothetical protein
MGDVVLLELLKERKLLPQFAAKLDAFCLIEDENLRGESLRPDSTTAGRWLRGGLFLDANQARQTI